jgi:nicotinamidase-related amidase
MKVEVELEVPELQEAYVDPAKTAVVLIDLENEFCDPKGANYIGEGGVETVYASARFIDRAREAGSKIIWVRSVREADALEFTVFHRPPHLIDGTWAVEDTPPLKVLEGEPVFKKHCHDCFSHTGLDDYLEGNRIMGPDWNIIVVGVALTVCVNHAVLGFSVRNYRVTVPLDCVAPREGGGAAATLWRYGHSVYAYNIAVSRSELIHFQSKADQPNEASEQSSMSI